jgi:hypothetical protein
VTPRKLAKRRTRLLTRLRDHDLAKQFVRLQCRRER